MNVKKEDKRVVMTKKILTESLFELLQTKQIDDITVTELCELSGINRGSFYKHYDEVKEIYNENKNKFTDSILNCLDGKKYGINSVITDILNIILKNRLLVLNIISYNEYWQVINTVVDFLTEKNKKDISSDEIKNLKLHYYYITGGAFSVIRYWLTGGCVESTAYITDKISEIIRQ